jgi:hypothetical protein
MNAILRSCKYRKSINVKSTAKEVVNRKDINRKEYQEIYTEIEPIIKELNESIISSTQV